jgi:drug/metabolite transporter (DMT)-like permease
VSAEKTRGSIGAAAIPVLFVFIWATGFIVARLVAPHTEPFTFLTIRVTLTSIVFACVSALMGARWPATAVGWANALIAGVLLQGVYLGGVFWSTRHGLPAALAALIGSLQPVLTAALAPWLLGERVEPRRWAGIVLGGVGAFLVLLPKLGSESDVPGVAILASVASVVAITLGTIWQKRTASAADLRTNAAVQFLGASLVLAPMALLTETGLFDASWPVWVGLGWSVLGLSVGAISLLLVLIRRGAVASVASLFYLVPPVVAVMAFVLFGERLLLVQMCGMAAAVIGVALASRAGAAG